MTARDEAIPLVVRIGGDGDVEAIAPAVIAAANGAEPQREEASRDPDKGVRLDAAPIEQDFVPLLKEAPAADVLPVEAASATDQANLILVAADSTIDARGVRLVAAPIDPDRLLTAFGEDQDLPLVGGLGQGTPDPLDGGVGI